MSSSAGAEAGSGKAADAAMEEKRALLLRLLQQRSAKESSAPLSPGQRSLYFLEKLNPGTAAFHLSHGTWFDGELDTAAFAAAVDEVVRRHGTLRTSFMEVGSRPVQVVSKERRRALTEVDLSSLPAASRRGLAERLAHAGARRPFDLGRAPLLRILLIRIAERRFLISLTLHHIISDAWSFGVFSGELWTHYQTFHRRAPRSLGPLPIQYVDHARRQLSWLESAECEREIAFWRSRLESAPASLEMLTGRPRPAVRSDRGGEHCRVISRDLAAGLRRLSADCGVSLFMTFLAVFAAQIVRYTGRRDFLVGTPVSGRNRPEVMGLIGYFVNMLALRIEHGGDPTLREFLEHVRSATVEAMGHQELPFERLVEELQPDRDLSQDPLFQVVFDFVSYEGGRGVGSGELRLDGNPEVSDLVIPHGTAMFDLEAYLEEVESGDWKCFLRWSTDLFDTSFAVRFLEHYERLLRAAVTGADLHLRELPLLSPAEHRQMLAEWNTVRTMPPPRRTLVECFEAQVAARPDAPAATAGTVSLTYRELDERAGRLGAWLRARGAGRESRIGLFGRRGLGMLVAILGIQKAGAAWIPLDPGHPDARLVAVLSAAGLDMVLAGKDLADRLAELAATLEPGPAVHPWDVASETPPSGEEPEAPRSGPQDLANVFFTSGSTGVPKGAMVEQAGMMNHLWAKVELAGLSAESVVVQNASHCFDISVWQFLSVLLAGGRVVVADDTTALDPAALLGLLERERVTLLETVPTLLDALIESARETRPEGERDGLSALGMLISNAETLPVPMVRRWFELFPRVPLVNTYGATECSDDTTHQVFHRPLPELTPRVAVGRPITAFAIYVLDAALNLMPPGSAGQIAMSGVGVGRGYLGAPKTTAAIFVPHPFPEESGERLYLTRDLGYFEPDGTLQFLGRIDNQVKVRGYRIEIGDVEGALDRHPDVQQAAVIPWGEGGAVRLAAYFVARESLEGSDLRSFLADLLPQYMVPDHFVQLPALPLNRNGKIDRKALPEPSSAPGAAGRVAPRNELEARILEVWQAVLGNDGISIHDDFFELGGHSLKAVQLVNRLRRDLDLAVEVRQVFLAPTVAELATSLAPGRGVEAPSLPSIERREERPSYPLSVAQQAMWASFQILRDVHKLPEVLELRGELDGRTLRAALGRLVARHEGLRTSFFEVEGEPRQRIHDTVELPWAEDDLARLRGAARSEALESLFVDESRPFDLERPPLLRVRLVRMEEARHLLLVNLPHIASDGGSEQVLFEELAEAYNALRAGTEDVAESGDGAEPRSEAPRYVDFAVWQRELLETGALDAEREHWLGELRDAPPSPELPGDRLPADEPPGRGATRTLDDGLAKRVEELAATRGATPFMAYLACFKTLLARWTGEADRVVGSALSGRIRPELETLIGLFTHPVALRTAWVGERGFEDFLREVRESTAAALAHQSYPFHSWLADLRRERRDAEYLPYSVSVMPQQRPALPAFEDLDVRYRQTMEIFAEAESGDWKEPRRGSEGVERGALEQLTGLGVDLTLGVLETDDGVRLILAAGRNKFRQATLERLLGQFEALLERVVDDPRRPLGEIELTAGGAELRTLEGFARGESWTAPPGEALVGAAERWLALADAGAVVILNQDGEPVEASGPVPLDPYELARHLRQHEAAAVVAGPALLDGLAAVASRALGPGLRTIVSAGGVPVSSVELARDRELLVFHPLLEGRGEGLWSDAGEDRSAGSLFAGRPAPSRAVRVLDPAGRPVPVGILGELSVGDQVSDLVATGFRGRWLEDGSMEAVEDLRSDRSRPWTRLAGLEPASEMSTARAYVAPRGSLERRLARLCQRVLDRPRISVEEDLLALATTPGDLVRLALEAGDANLSVSPADVVEHRTIAALAAATSAAVELSAAGSLPRHAPLTPLQEALFDRALDDPSQAVRSLTVEVSEALEPERLEGALEVLSRPYDALRVSFVRQGGLWGQTLGESVSIPCSTVDLGDGDENPEEIWRRAVDRLRSSLDPLSGPPLHALLGRSAKRPRLALAASALVVDDASWQVLVAALSAALGSGDGAAPDAPPSFQRWLVATERWRAYREEIAGLELVTGWSPVEAFTRDVEGGALESGRDGGRLEELYLAVLGRCLGGVVEVERDRRAGTSDLPSLAGAVGQFGSGAPDLTEDLAGAAVEELRSGLRVRLALASSALPGESSLELVEMPAPVLAVPEGGEKPDVYVGVVVAPGSLTTAVAVRPETVPRLRAADLAADLALALEEELAAEPVSPEGSEPLSQFAYVDLDAADLDDLLG